MRKYILFITSILFLLQSTQGQVNFVCKKQNTYIKRGVESYLQSIITQKQDIHSLMIVKRGNVLVEKYLRVDEKKTPHVMNSVSKAFTAMAIGIAVSEKRIRVEDKVISFFPDKLPDSISDSLKNLTIENLLTMTAGINVKQAEGIRTRIGKDWLKEFFSAKFDYYPGKRHEYNSMCTYVLSAIIQKVTNKKLVDYLNDKMFLPLNIDYPKWEESPQGINAGGWGLYIKTRDMAKFGQLLLQKGVWRGKRILPVSWIEKASSKVISTNYDAIKQPDWARGYGYQLWQCTREEAFRADGSGGQYIIVIPKHQALIITTAQVDDMQAELNLIWEYLLPVIMN